MKSKLAVKRELARVVALRQKKDKTSHDDQRLLAGAEQSLAWVMEDNAAAPSKCVIVYLRNPNVPPVVN